MSVFAAAAAGVVLSLAETFLLRLRLLGFYADVVKLFVRTFSRGKVARICRRGLETWATLELGCRQFWQLQRGLFGG